MDDAFIALSYRLLPILCNMSLAAGAAVLLILPVRLALRRAPACFSYALWAAVLFRLLCPVSLSAGFSLLGLLGTPAERISGSLTAVSAIPADVVRTPSPQAALSLAGEAVTNALPQGLEQLAADPLPVTLATAVWLMGVLVMAVWGLCSLLRLRRRLIGAVMLERGVFLADHIPSPFVLGVVRPKIYLPSRLTEEERRLALLHERRHIRRGDPLFRALAYAALCLHWWNPLVWLAFVLAGRDMELSCDEAAVRHLGRREREDYAALLLRLSAVPGPFLAFGAGNLRSRVERLLRPVRLRRRTAAAAAAVVLAAVVLCAVNALPESSVTAEQVEDGMSISLELRSPIRSWMLVEEIRQGETLLSSLPRLAKGDADDPLEDPYRQSFLLTTIRESDSGPQISAREGGAAAQWSLPLPEGDWTPGGFAPGPEGLGSSYRKTLREAETETVLCQLPLTGEAGDLTVRYLLVTSAEPADLSSS